MPTSSTFQTDMTVPRLSAAQREQQRAALTSITRQHESAVFTYLYRRVRRNVDVESLTKEVFARLVSAKQVDRSRTGMKSRLVELCQEVLTDFTQAADPKNAAWTELCLELDALAHKRQSGKSSAPPARDLSSGNSPETE